MMKTTRTNREECSAFPARLQEERFRVPVACRAEFLNLEYREERGAPDVAWARWVPENSDREAVPVCLEGQATADQGDQVPGACRAVAGQAPAAASEVA